MPEQQSSPNCGRPHRPWLQFSLRTLLLAMLVICLAMGWWVQRVGRQRAAVSQIFAHGGHINYDFQFDAAGNFRRDAFGNYLHGLEPPGPKWLRELVGDDYFQTPVKVSLEIDEGVGFEDRELEMLAPALKALPALRSLSLRGSPITDEGLDHLRELTQLREIDCQWTKVTDGGIESLQRDLPHCRITR